MVNALTRFSEARSLSPSAHNATRDIREIIKDALDNDELFDSISPRLLPPGKAGNRQMDQALVANAVFEFAPKLRLYDNLNHKALWGHIAHVLAAYGYQFSGGYVTAHILEHKRVEQEEQESLKLADAV